jgi:hypothetical protein
MIAQLRDSNRGLCFTISWRRVISPGLDEDVQSYDELLEGPLIKQHLTHN